MILKKKTLKGRGAKVLHTDPPTKRVLEKHSLLKSVEFETPPPFHEKCSNVTLLFRIGFHASHKLIESEDDPPLPY